MLSKGQRAFLKRELAASVGRGFAGEMLRRGKTPRSDDIAEAVLPVIEGLLSMRGYQTLQDRVYTWAVETFGKKNDHHALYLKMKEEVDELGKCYVNDYEALRDEAADLTILLMQLASRCNFDLLEAAADKMDINEQRAWELNADGTYRHTFTMPAKIKGVITDD